MKGRDESLALRSLTAAVETQTQFLRVFVDKVDAQFASINSRLDLMDGHINTLIDTVAEHIAHHGEAT